VPKTISRDELKMKIERHDEFLLVETLPEMAYHHAHLPGAINLPPERLIELAPTLLLGAVTEDIAQHHIQHTPEHSPSTSQKNEGDARLSEAAG